MISLLSDNNTIRLKPVTGLQKKPMNYATFGGGTNGSP